MEALSLLKYWRGGGAVFTRPDTHFNPRSAADSSSSFSSSAGTTIITAVTPTSSSESDDDEGNNDDGPFFDLEFTIPDGDDDDVDDDDDDDSESEGQTKTQADSVVGVRTKVSVVQEWEHVDNDNIIIGEKESAVSDDEDHDANDGTAEIKFTISPSSIGCGPSNAATCSDSPPAVDGLNAASETVPKFPVSSILKSATKFRVQMLKFNSKSKSESRHKDKPSKSEAHETKSVQKTEQQQEMKEKEEGREGTKPHSKLLTVKLKVEEVMPLVSLLFTRDHNGSTNSKGTTNAKANKCSEIGENISITSNSTCSSSNEDEKKFAKELMNKYLKKVKPLYVRVSKRYGDKLRFSGQLSSPMEDTEKQPPTAIVKASEEGAGGGVLVTHEASGAVTTSSILNLKGQKQGGNLQAGFRVVCKHLGKSRSASASALAQAAVPSFPAPEPSKRRDDSLLQQQDGIQSAILHCKRSFNASRGN